MKNWKVAVTLLTAVVAMAVPALAVHAQEATEVVVMSTTDLHGKVWDKNVLTGASDSNNMLRASTAVNQAREEYGAENVILIDNGDLFQGTPVSEVQLTKYGTGESTEPLAMAVGLVSMGYDAFVLGNHEFNYAWDLMSDCYDWLEENGVAVLAANVYYDGTVEGTKRGENAFTPYIVKTITVNGNEHKIGILGLENCDITRWDLPVNFPGLMFVSEGNDDFDMAVEARTYVEKMKEEGCEFIIVSYHGGLGNEDGDLSFGMNTENQGARMIAQNEGIDLLVNGHDHSTGYSNTFLTDATGKGILVVNGGGKELTKTVFSFTEDADGALAYELVSTENLVISKYDIDEDLQAKIKPYADLAEEVVEMPAGQAVGEWDLSTSYYTEQTDTIDLVSAAMIEGSTERMAVKYGNEFPEGLDHLGVDMAMTSVTASGSYVVQSGGISVKDVYRLYRYSNSLLVLKLSGQEIKDIMEENASQRLTVRVHNGEVFYYIVGDQFTNIIFGGLNFVYDMSKPMGERVFIEGFSNGNEFSLDGLYLVAVNNYILGNEHCGLRLYGEEDAVWSQLSDTEGETIQDVIVDYIKDHTKANGAVTPDDFAWHWELAYLDDPNALAPYEGEVAATFSEMPEDGHTYVIFHEAQSCALTDTPNDGGLDAVLTEVYGMVLTAPLAEGALAFTASVKDDGTISFVDAQGRYLVSGSGGGLMLAEEETDLALWRLEPAYGGWYVVNATASNDQALEYYNERFTTYHLSHSGLYTFNFYEVAE